MLTLEPEFEGAGGNTLKGLLLDWCGLCTQGARPIGRHQTSGSSHLFITGRIHEHIAIDVVTVVRRGVGTLWACAPSDYASFYLPLGTAIAEHYFLHNSRRSRPFLGLACF